MADAARGAAHRAQRPPRRPFGSQATGRASERSDVDLLVTLTDPSAARVPQLTGRLERLLSRDVQIVRIQDADEDRR